MSTFTYNSQGDLAAVTDPLGNTGGRTYDPVSRLIAQTDPRGKTASFVYDSVGRLIQATDSVGGTILNDYDDLDRLSQETTGLGTIQYAYDALGRRASMSVSGQVPVIYHYDDNSRLTQITQGSQVVDFTYDALGRRTRLALPNGVATEYKFDPASRLTELIYRNAVGVLGNLTYQYDSTSNRTQVGGSFARTLLPDPVASANYDAANRQLQFGDKQMAFDPNGNLTSIMDPSGVTTFMWDARNRLNALTSPSTNAAFTYDSFGRRADKQINGQVTQYLYDRVDIIQEVAGGTPVNYLRNLNIDETFVRDSSEHYLADALGSSIALTDPSGVLRVSYTYEAFGKTSATSTSMNTFQYTGRENDGTGLYYYRARFYNPTLARFIGEDPLRATGLANLYSYVDARPLNFPDPLGLSALADLAALAGRSVGGEQISVGEISETIGQHGLSLIEATKLGKLLKLGGISTIGDLLKDAIRANTGGSSRQPIPELRPCETGGRKGCGSGPKLTSELGRLG